MMNRAIAQPLLLVRFMARTLLVLCSLLCLNAWSAQAQVINENSPQDSLWIGVGADSADFAAQDFVASIKRLRKVGVWLKASSGTAQVSIAIMRDTGNNQPDFNYILHESQLVQPDTAGGWVWDSTFSAVLTVGQKYWVVIDGYNNLIGDGYAAVGTSNTFTSTSGPMRYSTDGGMTWPSIPGQPLAIFVEGDNCGFNLNIQPQQPVICPGGVTTFGVQSGFVAYSWSTGQTSAAITTPALGIYTVSVVDAQNCTSTASVLVLQGTIPYSGLLDYYEICEGFPLQISLPPFYSQYIWSTGQVGLNDTIASSGLYGVSITSSTGCLTVDSFEVLVRPVPNFEMGTDSSLCQGDSIFLAAEPGFVHYLWSTGAISQQDTLVATTSAWLQIIDSAGCVYYSDTVQYNFSPNPATPTLQILSNTLHSSFANAYQWFYNGQLLPDEIGQDVLSPNPGSYQVNVTNAFGCSSRSAVIQFEPETGGSFVSEGFSPNGDGLNEVFFVEGISRYPDCRLQIFNRWGEQILDQQPYLNDWEGTNAAGKPLPAGDYIYILEFGAGRETKRGTVMIVR